MAAFSTPVISVKGKPFDRGKQYGSQAREMIQKNIEMYFDIWNSLWGNNRSEILKQCGELASTIAEYDNDLLEEMKGIAEGAEVSFDEIMSLNARYELVFSQQAFQPQSSSECTSVVVLPEATESGHTLLGQNWDYKIRFGDSSVILEIERDDKPDLVTHTEAGVLAHRGINSAGIGTCLNAMVSSRDSFGPSIPFLVLGRAILDADSLSEAIKAVMRAQVSVSFNYLIAHRDGEAIDLEVSPVDVGFLHPESGILTHSNHFIALNGREDIFDLFKRTAPDSLLRAHRAWRILEEKKGKIDIDNIKELLSDHFNSPNSICRHTDERDEEPQQLATLSSMAMDLTEQVFYFTEGNPCKNQYHKHEPPWIRNK